MNFKEPMSPTKYDTRKIGVEPLAKNSLIPTYQDSENYNPFD